ncbi:MAG: hypothetical protein ACE5D7_09425 [Fidelibacterota bacterium]
MPGSKSFVEKIKERFFGEKTADYVPQSRELSPEIDRIIVYESRRGVWNEPRNMAVYLSRRLRLDSLSVIGSHYNLAKYSSVSSVVYRMDKWIKKDTRLYKTMLFPIDNVTKSHE